MPPPSLSSPDRARSLRPVNPLLPVHPLPVRAMHWLNAAAMVMMIGSGLTIHNADPILPWPVPGGLTLGGDLTGALKLHLAAMWLVAGNGLAYLAFGFASGRFRRKLLPVSLRGAFADTLLALRGRLGHEDLAVYNQVQRLLYIGVIATGVVAAVSGLALWKPVQMAPLLVLLGDFAIARIVHFTCMAAIFGFTLLHLAMALLVPRSIALMVLGGKR